MFELIKDKIAKNYIPNSKIEKAKLLNYTIAIIQPQLIAKSITCRVLIDKIDKNNFEVFNFSKKIPTEEEIANLYFKHVGNNYFKDIVEFMTCAPVAILVLINKEETYLDEHGIKTYYQSPIVRWKEMIGHKDPNVAKSTNPDSLRGLYGESIIKNGFWGSDNPSDAFRELSCFMLPLPSVSPKFAFEDHLMDINTILRFLVPVKPDHPDVSGRLDILARYGPVVNHHLLDKCICTDCRKEVRARLVESGKTMKLAKDKIVSDEFISKNNKLFCMKCLGHFNQWSHLLTGLEGTHIMTNEEIDFMITEMNKEDLYQILLAEKGTSARTIISKYDIKNPPQAIVYKTEHVLKLLSLLEVDYYDRYNLAELQNLIQEDRRIRLNYWVSKMIDKPVDKFDNPKLINFTGDDKEIKDMKNPRSKNFTLLRHLPIQVENKEKNKLQATVLQHPILQKDKLTQHEISQKVEKLLQKNISMIAAESKLSDINIVSNMILLRNFELEAIKSKEAKDELKKAKEKLEQKKYN